ncbi:MAG: helix-turn-helix domain-containing protein [Nanoarchaeota archaeon]|nr:helix-turn-helix domain-containing protein [Nanoarchaeota archaeon]
MNSLRNELLTLKEQLIKEKEENKLLKEKLSKISEEKAEIKPKQEVSKLSSTGNEGVIHSFIHSFIHSDTHYAHKKQPKIKEFKDEIDRMFSMLPKQEFLVFLTIYQLEDDIKRSITYIELAKKLNLTEGCIRTYISNLLKKNLPIDKNKVNNRIVELSINSYFRDLNLKQKLINLYYLSDIEQKRLLDVID